MAVCIAVGLAPGPVAGHRERASARRGHLRAVAYAAREVQGTVQWPGAGAWAGSAWEPPDALAAVDGHRETMFRVGSG
jgi:hypothetical protein